MDLTLCEVWVYSKNQEDRASGLPEVRDEHET